MTQPPNHSRGCVKTPDTKFGNDQNSGLTLVELLVVIAVIGILAALLLPVLVQSRRKAQQIQCVGNLHQQGIALQSFLANNHGYPVIDAGKNADVPGTWKRQLETGGFDVSKPVTNYFEVGVWRCPSARWGAWFHPDDTVDYYAYNCDGVEPSPISSEASTPGLRGAYSKSQGFAPVGESSVVSPGAMMAIGDSLDGGAIFYRGALDYFENRGFASSRHQGKANVAFCDGHVESPTLGFIFGDTSDEALSRWNMDHLPHRDKL
jgi:prepilin-type processing-associated H-X9-DG protein/prepilin-type N-terminal cleavage/methylation domain-containing protein